MKYILWAVTHNSKNLLTVMSSSIDIHLSLSLCKYSCDFLLQNVNGSNFDVLIWFGFDLWISWENFVHHCSSLTHAYLIHSLDYINLKQMPTHNFELNLSWWINILNFSQIHQGLEVINFTGVAIWNLKRTVTESATKFITFETNMIFHYVTDVSGKHFIFYYRIPLIWFYWNKKNLLFGSMRFQTVSFLCLLYFLT